MPLFKAKPVVKEAFQMTRERRWDNSEWPEWLNKAWNLDRHKLGSLHPTYPGNEDPRVRDPENTLSIMTLEGNHLVSWDDWIIQGLAGELYPCKPDIFAATYELVEEAT